MHIFSDKWSYGELPHINQINSKSDMKLICIGNCIAKNINRWLSYNNIIPDEYPWDALFNSYSIKKEFSRLIFNEEWEKYVFHGIDKDSGESFTRDPWRTWLSAKNLELLRNVNDRVNESARELLKNSNTILIVLGLSEVWFSKNTPNVILNRVPYESIKEGDNSYKSRFSTVTEIKHDLQEILRIINEIYTNEPRVVFSVSPIPLRYTALKDNIRVANNLSFSSIYVAIQEVINEGTNTEYFPLNEVVEALSETEKQVWQEDGRHLNIEVIDIIGKELMKFLGVRKYSNSNEPFWINKVNKEGQVIGKQYY